MTDNKLLQDSCRFALKGMLHHLDKFALYANVDLKQQIAQHAAELSPFLSINEEFHLLFLKAEQISCGFLANTTAISNKQRLITLFEQIDRADKNVSYRYSLKPQSPNAIFPVIASDNAEQVEYKNLWQAFMNGLQQIPKTHREALPLYLDHLDSCLQTYTHSIPYTADVSLYDHSKVVSALVTALWRYHRSSDKPAENQLAEFLLIQGDFFGIQHFIFAQGGDSTKKAAKLLRGRSFYVSLIAECAALKVLEALHLPSTSQIINAAGKFLIVAPNTDETKSALKQVQAEFNQWFLANSYGQSGLGLASQVACCDDFVCGDDKRGFKDLMTRLNKNLERSKYQHFDLCGANPAPAVFADYLDSFKYEKVCAVNDKAPASKNGLSDLAQDQINIGSWLVKQQRLVISKQAITGLNALKIPLFGYAVHFVDSNAMTASPLRTGSHQISRLFDFSPATQENRALWNGYARRNISGYVPYFENEKIETIEKYKEFLTKEEREQVIDGEVKTLTHLAYDHLCQDKDKNGNLYWRGIPAIGVLKGDIDNLGALFQNGLQQPTFAKMAALSRQVNNFFAVYLPYLCRTKYPNTYIVFAGGDDFFLLGSWWQLMQLANTLQDEFKRYVAANAGIHFSAGLSVCKPKIPIQQLANMGEEALEHAKKHTGKNAVTCFGQTVIWADFKTLTEDRYQRLDQLRHSYALSTGYIYGLLRLCDMAADNQKPENSLWRSQLYYRTYRNVTVDKDQKKRACEKLVADIGEQGIETFKNGYRITLQAHLYHYRKQA